MNQNEVDKSSKPNQRKSSRRLVNSRRSKHREQQQVEDALLFTENIIRCSSSAIAACDLEGNMTYGNPAFHKMWGFSDPKEHLGKPFWQFWLVEDRLDEIMQALRGDGLWFDKIKARRKDGEIFNVQVSASMVFDRKGDPVALTSTSIDITESERVKEKLDHHREVLQCIYDNIPVLIVMWDPQLRFFTLNSYRRSENLPGGLEKSGDRRKQINRRLAEHLAPRTVSASG